VDHIVRHSLSYEICRTSPVFVRHMAACLVSITVRFIYVCTVWSVNLDPVDIYTG
jgi:hypothetical protein